MTYTSNIRAAIDGLHDTSAAALAALESATLASVSDPAASNGVTLFSAIANAKRARDRIDSVLEHLEAARLEQARLTAPEPTAVDGIPAVDRPQVTPFTPRVIASGVHPVTDYPDRPA